MIYHNCSLEILYDMIYHMYILHNLIFNYKAIWTRFRRAR